MFPRGDEKINGTLVFIGSSKERCVAAESAASIETGVKKNKSRHLRHIQNWCSYTRHLQPALISHPLHSIVCRINKFEV